MNHLPLISFASDIIISSSECGPFFLELIFYDILLIYLFALFYAVIGFLFSGKEDLIDADADAGYRLFCSFLLFLIFTYLFSIFSSLLFALFLCSFCVFLYFGPLISSPTDINRSYLEFYEL